MKAGWLALSCVPAESAPGVCVWALTKPGTARKRRPSMTRSAFFRSTSPTCEMILPSIRMLPRSMKRSRSSRVRIAAFSITIEPMPGESYLAQRLSPHLSRARACTVLQELVRVPSPQTDLLEDEPQLREFMKAALMPRMKALGMSNVRLDAMGNLIAEKGKGKSGRSMMLVTHAMNQPPNTMPDPYGGKVIDATKHGLPGEAVLGKGASEQKGTMVAMLHAIEAVRAADLPDEGRLFFICFG